MTNRTFCLMIASVLMLAGALTALVVKKPVQENKQVRQALQAEVQQEDKYLLLPEEAEVIEWYGANYSTEYAQWSMCEQMTLQTAYGNSLYAPISGFVEQIEGGDSGSRIMIRSGNMQVELYPVYGLRVFAGSRVTQRNIIGSLGDFLTIAVKQNGVPVDPVAVSAGEIYNISESALEVTGAGDVCVE